MRGGWWDKEDRAIKEKQNVYARRKAQDENKLADKTAHLTTEQLKERAEKELLREEGERRIEEQQAELLRFLGTATAYVNSDWNATQIREGLKAYLKSNNREWLDPKFLGVGLEVPTWCRDDLLRTADCEAAEGRLELRSEWSRKTPTEAELYAMPRDGEGSLRELADSTRREEHPRAAARGPRIVFTDL